MISTRKFLGISTARRRNRRLAVVAAGLALLAVAALFVLSESLPNHSQQILGRWSMRASIACYLILFLSRYWDGFLRFIGNFGGRSSARPDNSVRTLFTTTGADRPALPGTLDERDIRLRNAAHYHAYQIVVWLLPIILVGSFAGRSDAVAALMPGLEPLIFPLLFLLTLVAIGLPEILIMWNEPDIEEPNES